MCFDHETEGRESKPSKVYKEKSVDINANSVCFLLRLKS